VIGRIVAIAALSFREASRNRILYALLAVTVLAILASYVLGLAAGSDPARRAKVMADFGLSAVAFFAAIVSIFVGTTLVYSEIEKRTVYAVLARPVGRAELVLGKYAGLLVLLLVVVSLSGGLFLGFIALAGVDVTLDIASVLAYTYLEVAVVTAVAILFSTVAHPIEGAVFAFVVYLAGHATASLKDLGADVVRDYPGPLTRVLEKVLYALYVALPNLENFNVRAAAVHGLPLPVPGGLAVAYAALYASILLALACLAFRRRTL